MLTTIQRTDTIAKIKFSSLDCIACVIYKRELKSQTRHSVSMIQGSMEFKET